MLNPKKRYSFLAVLVTCCLALVAMTGCAKKETKPDEAAEEQVDIPNPLKVLVIGDPGLGQRIARQWSARREGKLTVVDREAADFTSAGFEIDSEVDVVIYPPAMIGELIVRGRLQMVRKELLNSDGFNKIELLRHFRTSIIRHHDKTWAVPLGGPNFAMLCNRALFDALKSKPPATWEQLERSLEKIGALLSSEETDPDKTDSETFSLAANVDMPLATGWAAYVFLARVAPAICNRGKLSTVFDRNTMEPLIKGPAFVEALEQIVAIASKRSLDLKPEGVFDLASSGRSAIALSWPSLGFENELEVSLVEDDETGAGEKNVLMIRPLPGMEKWFDRQSGTWNKRSEEDDPRVELTGFSGLVASVTATSPNDRTAWDFLEWLPSKSISVLTMVESPTSGPFRASHLGDASRWTGDSISIDVADEYADVIAANHERNLILMFPRIRGHQQYIDALDGAVRKAVAGEQSPEQALKSAAQKWDEITETTGRDQQIWELRKESGLR